MKEEIENEEKITDIEVILEGEKEEQRDLNNLEKAIHQLCMDEPELYLQLHETVRTTCGTQYLKEILAPDGDKIYSVRPQGAGRIMLYLNDEKEEVTLQIVRQGVKEKYTWDAILSYLTLITDQEDGRKNWEEISGQQFPEKEPIAPVQPKKEKKRKEEKQAELPNDILGQTEIEKDFPKLLPKPVKMPEIQKKEPDCTGTMQESEPSVEKAVDNLEKQNPAGSRWEYMKTMGTYAASLYMAASMKKMPHMMLGSAEYWQKWLETGVDENGEKIGKKQSDS